MLIRIEVEYNLRVIRSRQIVEIKIQAAAWADFAKESVATATTSYCKRTFGLKMSASIPFTYQRDSVIGNIHGMCTVLQ